MAPEIYPGTVTNGLKLAFVSIDQFGDLFGDSPAYPASGYASEYRETGGSSPGGDVRKIILETFKQLQNNVDEVRAGWAENKKEMARLTNAYLELVKEMGKYTIRMNLLENQLKQLKKPALKNESANRGQPVQDNVIAEIEGDTKPAAESYKDSNERGRSKSRNEALQQTEEKAPKTPGSSLNPEKLREWEEWQEPKEWQESGE